jgi:cell division protein FtsQ
MKAMDHRIARRRHRVNEQRAETRLRIVIGLVAVAVLLGAGWWLVRSPFLSIDTVTVTGADHVDVTAALERLGVGAGTPTISIDEAAIETALASDPWVAQASVVTTWPGSLEIEVVERAPVAAFQRGDALVSITRTGAVVEVLRDLGAWPLVVSDGATAPRPGEVMSSTATLGALEFVAALPGELASGSVVTVGADGRLLATVAGHPVRLGRSVELGPKAAALAAVIESGVEPGSTIDVTAPRHPAVANPQPEVEGER